MCFTSACLKTPTDIVWQFPRRKRMGLGPDAAALEIARFDKEWKQACLESEFGTGAHLTSTRS